MKTEVQMSMLDQQALLQEEAKSLIKKLLGPKYNDKPYLSQTANQIKIKNDLIVMMELLVPKVFEDGLHRHY